MTETKSTKERNELDTLIASFTLERFKSLERELCGTNAYQAIQARKARAYSQIEESIPEGLQAALSGFADLWAKTAHYQYHYYYSRSFGDAVLFISRILGIKADVFIKLIQQRKCADSNPMTESLYSLHGLSSISEGEDFFTSHSDSNMETDFWQFIKDCMDERLCLIGSEGLNEAEYRDLRNEAGKLALLLEEALSEDKKGLVNEYDDLTAEEEAVVQDILYPQGFIDAVRILYGNCN